MNKLKWIFLLLPTDEALSGMDEHKQYFMINAIFLF